MTYNSIYSTIYHRLKAQKSFFLPQICLSSILCFPRKKVKDISHLSIASHTLTLDVTTTQTHSNFPPFDLQCKQQDMSDEWGMVMNGD